MIIEDNVINEIEINKSKFITYIYKVKTLKEINEYLEKLKKDYKDATHICYAYKIDNTIKFNDDNEPVGTAGIPILEVLNKNNLNYVACFVIRYFGGIKLGSGGLIRAYSNSTSECLKKTKIKKLEKLFKIKLTISYQENKLLEKIIKNENIKEKDYQENITYILIINQNIKEKIDKLKINYKILDDNYF